MDGLIYQGLLGFSLCAAITTRDFVGVVAWCRHSFSQCLLSVCFVPDTTLGTEIQRWIRHSLNLREAYSPGGHSCKWRGDSNTELSEGYRLLDPVLEGQQRLIGGWVFKLRSTECIGINRSVRGDGDVYKCQDVGQHVSLETPCISGWLVVECGMVWWEMKWEK